ncbi:hypothetical protein SODALDRAFT_357838 [Sodiomyces alkalinus F11]|uniref:Uncharacterized protein n=1 Tax=Sodiomyces alkalinus (strain CBS 110278 / VKM F-3762 / F11) TaxID=1314773 RepID=A0A3N2Q555_SODAK|nr:hypothetical protein SODALDRAFT_357838 [Sodiomyces alkalinus F11]ROT41755.1 hypothetical protein SODALDRAFT_357838 [Sodiomyces alkalinus F11]
MVVSGPESDGRRGRRMVARNLGSLVVYVDSTELMEWQRIDGDQKKVRSSRIPYGEWLLEEWDMDRAFPEHAEGIGVLDWIRPPRSPPVERETVTSSKQKYCVIGELYLSLRFIPGTPSIWAWWSHSLADAGGVNAEPTDKGVKRAFKASKKGIYTMVLNLSGCEWDEFSAVPIHEHNGVPPNPNCNALGTFSPSQSLTYRLIGIEPSGHHHLSVFAPLNCMRPHPTSDNPNATE